tara:strand:- start:668 stop:1942 length:1275 start_codon:yes stop_codon:yes gene_type:complete
MKAITLIDANNFYASCEQSINPALAGKPIVILSNNDGCIIARSSEARNLGIQMGTPYFKIKHKLNSLGIISCSSNYELYGDISQRLMNLLKMQCEELEVYSIDEAFGFISRPNNLDLRPWARSLRILIYQNLGIPISIGIGKSKVQAKIANKLAKRDPKESGIFDISTNSKKNYYLENIDIKDIWGIGSKSSEWLRSRGIRNALQFRDISNSKISNKLGITGKRLQLELRGENCIPFKRKENQKKEITVSRSFSKPIANIRELSESLALYITIASYKLRKQGLLTRNICVFIRTNPFSSNEFHNLTSYRTLNEPTNNTQILIKTSIEILVSIYKADLKFTKAGVIMRKLSNDKYIQRSINYREKTKESHKGEILMNTIDNINKKFGEGSIYWAASGIKREWEMRRNLLSYVSTTNIKRIPLVIT